MRFLRRILTPTDPSRLLLVASQIAALFFSRGLLFFNDVEHVGVCGQRNGSVLQLTSPGCA